MSTKELARLFVELPSFSADWKALGLGDNDLRRLQLALLRNPKAGPVMPETGGVRKVRVAFPRRGKSGSARVVYIDFEAYEKIFLLAVYQKSDQENLSKRERNIIRLLVAHLEAELKKGGYPHA